MPSATQLTAEFSRNDYIELILHAVSKHPAVSSKINEKVRQAESRPRPRTTNATNSKKVNNSPPTARDLENLSQVNFIEVIAEIVSLHPSFIKRVREVCKRIESRCPKPVDYENLQEEFQDLLEHGLDDFDPDVHDFDIHKELVSLVNKVVNSVNENSTRAVLDDAFECLCKFEELIAENDDVDDKWESDFISNNMMVVGSFWKAKGGPAGPNGERIKEIVVDLTENYDLDEDVLEQIWEEEEMEEALEKDPKRRKYHR